MFLFFLFLTKKVVFGFSAYTTISEVDLAVTQASLLGGSCAVGAALSKCHQDLFYVESTRGRSRALLVLVAGKSTDDISSAAASLQICRVKITVVGIGNGIDQYQLEDMASASSFVLTTASIDGLFDISGSASAFTSQGKFCNILRQPSYCSNRVWSSNSLHSINHYIPFLFQYLSRRC